MSNSVKIFIATICCLLIQVRILPAQNYNATDLRLKLKMVKHDTDKVEYLVQLASLITQNNPDSAILLCDQTIAIAEQHKNSVDSNSMILFKSSAVYALQMKAAIIDHRGDTYTAMALYKLALKAAKDFGDELGVAAVYNNLGMISSNQSDYAAALSYYEQSLKIHEKYALNSDKIKKRNGQLGVAAGFTNMGIIFTNQLDYETALKYFFKSLKIHQELENARGIFNTFLSIAGVYTYQNKIKEAEMYYVKSLDVLKLNSNTLDESNALVGFAYLNEKNGKPDEALVKYQKCAKLKEQILDFPGVSHAYLGIARSYMLLQDNKNALKFGLLSLEIGKKVKMIRRIGAAARVLREIYLELKKPKLALAMYKLNISMRDSLNNEAARKSSIKSQLKYEYGKKAAADSVKNAEVQKVIDAELELQNASLRQEQTQRYLLYGGILLVTVFLIFVFNRFQLTQRQKKIIEEQKVIVDHAFHDLEEKNKEVLDSIYYARRIQRALITSEYYIQKNLNKLRSE